MKATKIQYYFIVRLSYSQLVFTCLNLKIMITLYKIIIKTLEKSVKFVQN